MRYDLIISGVGGQGTVLASRILATAALQTGLNAYTAETIGMAQREGTVLSHVRMGTAETGPLIPLGQATALIAFEPAEAVRALPFVSRSAQAVVNIRPVIPVTVALGKGAYQHDEILDYLSTHVQGLRLVDAAQAAREAGGLRFTNVVMLGAASAAGLLPVSRESLVGAIEQLVPQRFKVQNVNAFELGGKLAAIDPKAIHTGNVAVPNGA